MTTKWWEEVLKLFTKLPFRSVLFSFPSVSLLCGVCVQVHMHTCRERTISDVILQELFTLFCETRSLTGLELANSLGCLVGEPQGSAYLHCSSMWITSTCHRVPFFFKIEDIWSSQVLTLAREALYLSQTMCPAQALESRSGLFRGHLFVCITLWRLMVLRINRS